MWTMERLCEIFNSLDMTSTSTQNTQEHLKILNNHQSLLDIENDKPTVDDFDMTEDEIIAMTKDENFPITETGCLPLQKEVFDDQKESKPVSMNDENEPIDDLEEFVNMDDPFSIDESDDDMFEATPERTFQPLNTSTTKSKQRILSQGPVVSLKWNEVKRIS